jgi:hypothetical protein
MATEGSAASKIRRATRVCTLVGFVAILACAGRIADAAAQAPVRAVYYTNCGLEDKPDKCELRTMPESLASSAPVSALPAWYTECGPDEPDPLTTVSEDGTTAVTLEDRSSTPGAYGDTRICRLVVTNLATGENHVLPAYTPRLLESIISNGWTISPNGQDIAIDATDGVYIQNVQTAAPPQLLRTGFKTGGIGWYPESTRLLIQAEVLPGGRGAAYADNRLFEFTLSGHLLGRWLIKPVSTYLFGAPFIQVSATGQVYIGGSTSLLPGAQPNMPNGYYLVRLGKHASVRLITRVSRTAYGGVVPSFGVDAESGLLFITNEAHNICSVSINRGTRHCVNTPGRGVQVALPPS